MNEKDITKHLKNGISEITPNCFEEIMEKISVQEDIPKSDIVNKKWSAKKVITGFVAMAACFLMTVGTYNIYQKDIQKVYTIVELDVNPSIEFGVNKSDEVVSAEALNHDGKKILEHLSLERENLNEAALAVMDELVKQGFITKEKSTVLVSVENENEDKTEQIKEDLSEEIIKYLEQEDIDVTVLKQTIVKDDISESIAKEYNISQGKALLVKTVLQENTDLSKEELANMTVDEIAKKTGEKDIAESKVPKNHNLEQTVQKQKKEPTQITENKSEETPTQMPENKEKAKPTKIPEDKNKENVKPTKPPMDDRNIKPTPPIDDRKEIPPQSPVDEGKEKQPKPPMDDRKEIPDQNDWRRK